MARLALVNEGMLDSFGRDRGSGVVLPTVDLTRGDTYFHTDLACLMVYTGTAWRQAEIPTSSSTTAPLYDGMLRNDPVLGLLRGAAASWESAARPPQWVTPTLVTRTNLAADYVSLRYRHVPAIDSVHIAGVLAAGAQVNGVFTLPAGLRPAKNFVTGVQADTASASVFVMSTGSVNVPATSSWLSLNFLVPLG